MRTESVSTHALLPGDQVMSHGARFEVTSVAWYSDALAMALQLHRGHGMLPYQQKDLDIEAENGPVVVCETRLLNDGGSIPRDWLRDWRIQGNGAARWARVAA